MSGNTKTLIVVFAILVICLAIVGLGAWQWINAVKVFEIATSTKSIKETINSAQKTLADGSSHLDPTLEPTEQIVSVSPKDYYTLNNMGLAYLEKRDYPNAEKYLLASIKINDNYRASHNNLGSTYRGLGKDDLAEVEYKKAIAIDPANPKSYSNLGILYWDKEEFNEALYYYVKSLELNKTNSFLDMGTVDNNRLHIGYIYCENGDFRNATLYLTEYLKWNPGNSQARNLLNRCRE